MRGIGGRDLFLTIVSTGLCVLIAALAAADGACAAPTALRLGYGGAAEEPLWLVIAKPEMWPNSGIETNETHEATSTAVRMKSRDKCSVPTP